MFVPALVTRMSIRPWRFSMSAAARVTALLSETSSWIASASPTAFNCASPDSFVRWVRPEITTRAPAFASSSAPARPMPLPPPVIQATLPFRSAPGILSCAEQVFLLLLRHLGTPTVGQYLQRARDCGPCKQRVAPLLHVRILVDVHALA